MLNTTTLSIAGFVAVVFVAAGFLFFSQEKTPGNEATPVTIAPMTTNVIMKTNKGEIELELLSDLAPKTVENFLTLAKSGFYNGVKFHRVIQGFMIQGGDPLSKDDAQKGGWGTGGPGYAFEDEIHAENKNLTGTIAMANAGPNTNGSQFFINTADNVFLNDKHTVFGKVVRGLDVVRLIEDTPTDGNDRPVSSVVIEGIIVK
ncbi:MAG: peptidylprolyl isomerase [Parcubacteria group bacterium]|nr:peptidylprolyl isomerase [Parcubacteria group bacterium]